MPDDEGTFQDTEWQPRRRKGSPVSRVLLIVGIVLLVAAVGGFGFIAWRYWHASSEFRHIASMNSVLEGDGLENYALDIDWTSLRASNPEIVAWICVPGTVVNYPVVQAADNSFYLTHDFAGANSANGCIFLDYESSADLSGRNTIIYGHNMLDGSMFASFLKYEGADYLEQHPYVLLATPDGVTHRLKICCTIVASDQENLRQTAFAGDADFRKYVQDTFDRNVIDTDVKADQFDHLFTFATCSYQFNDARTLVYAVEVDKYGNMLSEDTSTSDSVERSGQAGGAASRGSAGTATPTAS